MGAILDRAREAVRQATAADALVELVTITRDREQRRHDRERRGGNGRTPQCGGCRKFLRSNRQDCECGFRNDIRGRRNRGGFHG